MRTKSKQQLCLLAAFAVSALLVRNISELMKTFASTASTSTEEHSIEIKLGQGLWSSEFRNLNSTDADDTMSPEFPYKCGMWFFYHIPSTGGATINQWLIKHHKAYNISYMTHWGRNINVATKFYEKMEDHVKQFGPSEWRITHAHGYSMFPNASEPALYKWREEVESQGCKFVVNTVFRDALSHTVSQIKSQNQALKLPQFQNFTKIAFDEWLSHLKPAHLLTPQQPQLWGTQLDYFLYNKFPKNINVTRQEKVRRGLELLRDHFDVAIYSNHDQYVDIFYKLTGLKRIPMTTVNQYDKDITFSPEEFDLLKKATFENGDAEFIDAVKHIYGAEMGYLFHEI